MAETAEADAPSGRSSGRGFELSRLLQSDKFSKEKMELQAKLDVKKKEVQEKQKKILELQDKASKFTQVESQLEEKARKLEASNKERDILEKELKSTRSELSGIKRTLELEWQERRDLETKALGLMRDAKRKWENAEKEKIAQLNKHIETQTMKITELCASNNEMSSRLQRTESELQTANAELDKLRIFQTQYKESLAKTRELNRQSVQGVEIKLEEIATRAHNQLADLRAKLDFETAKNADLEMRLRNEQDSNHCRESRLNVALELAQNELKDCQEQLRTIQATLPARDAEIEALRKQVQEKARHIDDLKTSEQILTTLQEQLERMNLENEQLKQQLQATKSDLNETIINLEQSEALALNLEQAAQDKAALQKRLQDSLVKEEEQLRKVCNLEELLKRLEQSVTKLEAENATLRKSDKVQVTTRGRITDSIGVKIEQEEVKKLEQQLQTLKEDITTAKQTAKQAQLTLWKKEKELSDANLDKRIAVREAKRAEDKIKMLQEEKQKLQEKLDGKAKEEEENSKKLLKELDIAKKSLNDITKEASRNKLQADSAQRALTQSNHQIGELQTSNASLRRELDATRKQTRSNQDRVDALNAENRRLTQTLTRHNEEKSELDSKIAKLEQDIKAYELNIELLKETCTVLEEQLTDYERLTSDHETRENILIQDKMKLQKELEAAETKAREAHIAQNEEKTRRLIAERNMTQLESETSDIETERNSLITQRDQYKILAQKHSTKVEELSRKCGEMESRLLEMDRVLDVAREDSRIVKEESSEYLTRVHELKEANFGLMADLQNSIDHGQELRSRIAELENVLEEMRQFYQEREVKAECTRQQQTKLIDYLQLKLEEYEVKSKKKKTVCDKLLGTKQKENLPPTNTGMPVGYRELQNQFAKEQAKVKTLTDQLLILKAKMASEPTSPTSPDGKRARVITNTTGSLRRLSPQRINNLSHRFGDGLLMRTGKCAVCAEAIRFGRRAAMCNKCQIMTHLGCAVSAPTTCNSSEYSYKNWKNSDESISSIGDSVQTLAIDQPDKPDIDVPQGVQRNEKNEASAEGWVKVPGRSKSCWERKYLSLEGSCLSVYEHQPCAGMEPIMRLNLSENNGFNVSESVLQPDVPSTAKSDIPFILRIESNSTTTCWPSSRLDVMALSQADKRNWIKVLKSVTSQSSYSSVNKYKRYQTIFRLEKYQLDLNCVVDLDVKNVFLLGAQEGLFSYCASKSRTLTTIRGVKQIHQLSLHPHLDLALMIAGEYRELVYCNLRILRNNALAADCSKPAINTKSVLSVSDSCHLYQLQSDILCAATASHVILLKWRIGENSGEFIGLRELETQEPCSCAIFTSNLLIVGCHKFFQIDLQTYSVDEFPDEDNSSIKAAISGAAKLGIFPVCILNICNIGGMAELLLCYNEFGVFVDENGRRTRAVDPVWSHLPFAFAFCKPYLFIVHFSSVEIMKLDSEAYNSPEKNPERTLIELSNPRYLGTTSNGIYVTTVNSYLELLNIEGFSSTSVSDSLTSLDTLTQEDESSSEFSFTSSLIETLDGQGKKVHFCTSAEVQKY